MNILKKLTKKNLLLNKKRTIGTLIGIILSSALITAVGGMFYVLQNTLVEGSIQADGYWHIQLSDISEDEVKKVSLNQDFNHMEIVKDLGHSIIKIGDYDTIDAHIYSMNKDTFDYLGYKLEDGVFPTNENEIVVGKSYLRYTKINIGDVIKLSIGDIVNNNDDSYIINDKEYEFKVVGTINSYNALITTNNNSNKNDVYLTLKNPNNYKKDFEELLSSGNFKDYQKHQDLLRWEVFSFNDNTLSFLLSIIGVVIFIILITSVFSIRNSFAISTTEKLRDYGMLRSVGATKKQIKKMVLLEGLDLGLVGIPLGSLIGLLITYLLTVIVNLIAFSGGLIDEKFLYYKFSIIPFLIATILGFIMIYLSLISSIKKASKVSPIKNIRNASDIKNNKNLRVPLVIQKIFKIGGTLSYKNLKRSKKKYRVTIISLTISIFVFILVSSFLNYGVKTINEEYINLNYNVSANVYTEDNSLNIKKLQSLDKSHINYIEDYKKLGFFYLKDTSHILEKDTIVSDTCTKYESLYSDNCIGEKIDSAYIHFIIYDDDSFKELCKKLNLNYENIKEKGILLNTTKNLVSNITKYIKLSNYKKGDIITLDNSYYDYKLTYEVGAVTEYRPWGYETYYYNTPSLIVSEKYYPYKDSLLAENIYYEANDADKLVQDIKNISEDINIINIDEEVKEMKSMILIFSIFIYGFIVVVTLIGVTSVFNTITSNMELRKKEFAILKSIGMTKHEFNNMIILEAFFYSFKSLFYGIILGIGGSYIVYRLFAEKVDYGYILPISAIIISIIFILILVYTIMRYSIGKVNKQNIIETIRSDNI